MTQRPAATEYAPYYEAYVVRVPGGELTALLEAQRQPLLDAFTSARAAFAYAPGKWTSEEVVGHIVDIERVFSYRAMCWTRGLQGVELAGVDQDQMVPASRATERGMASLAEEFDHLRRSNVALIRSLDGPSLAIRGRASGTEMTVRAMLHVLYGHAQHHADVLRQRYA